jgi:hypothetical protein
VEFDRDGIGKRLHVLKGIPEQQQLFAALR